MSRFPTPWCHVHGVNHKVVAEVEVLQSIAHFPGVAAPVLGVSVSELSVVVAAPALAAALHRHSAAMPATAVHCLQLKVVSEVDGREIGHLSGLVADVQRISAAELAKCIAAKTRSLSVPSVAPY